MKHRGIDYHVIELGNFKYGISKCGKVFDFKDNRILTEKDSVKLEGDKCYLMKTTDVKLREPFRMWALVLHAYEGRDLDIPKALVRGRSLNFEYKEYVKPSLLNIEFVKYKCKKCQFHFKDRTFKGIVESGKLCHKCERNPGYTFTPIGNPDYLIGS